MACGQSFAAVRSGMAECTPNFRAAYDAAETTPRSSRCPPTTTGLPFSDGSNNSSTDTKKASMSTWKMVLFKACIRRKDAGADCTSDGTAWINFAHYDFETIRCGLGVVCERATTRELCSFDSLRLNRWVGQRRKAASSRLAINCPGTVVTE